MNDLPDDVVDVEVLVPVTMDTKGGGDVRVPPYNTSSLFKYQSHN